MENLVKNNDNQSKHRSYIGIAALILFMLIAGSAWYVFRYEDWQMARLAKNYEPVEQGEHLLKEYQEAKAKLQNNPNDAVAYATIGVVKKEFKDFIGAEKAYLKAVSLDPQNIFFLNTLGGIEIKLKKYPEAEKYYLQSLALNPEFIATYYELVSLYHDYYIEKKSELEKVLLKGVKKMPDDQNLLSLLASYYRDTGQKEKAVEIYERILLLRPDDKLLQSEINNLK